MAGGGRHLISVAVLLAPSGRFAPGHGTRGARQMANRRVAKRLPGALVVALLSAIALPVGEPRSCGPWSPRSGPKGPASADMASLLPDFTPTLRISATPSSGSFGLYYVNTHRGAGPARGAMHHRQPGGLRLRAPALRRA